MKLLEGKVAVVTGAARGIGKAIAIQFAKEGANVAFTDLAIDENGKKTEEELNALGVKAKGYASNAANFEDTHKVIDQIMQDFGRIDILVNNAGITKDGLMMRMSEAQWDAVLNVNLKSLSTSFMPLRRSCAPAQRFDYQYVVRGGCQRQCRTVQLFGFESRYDRTCEVHRQGDGTARHPCQRHRSRLHHYRNDQRPARRGKTGLVPANSAAPRRYTRGCGEGGSVPCLRPLLLRERTGNSLLRSDELLISLRFHTREGG